MIIYYRHKQAYLLIFVALLEFHFRDYLVYENGFFACTRENKQMG